MRSHVPRTSGEIIRELWRKMIDFSEISANFCRIRHFCKLVLGLAVKAELPLLPSEYY